MSSQTHRSHRTSNPTPSRPGYLALILGVSLAPAALLGCSGQPLAGPGSTSDGLEDRALLSQSAPGAYDISFFKIGTAGLEPVDSLPACTAGITCQELILGAHVSLASDPESPARGGAVVFQYCSLKGLPPNDIERADEAPSAACADGSATWANLPATLPVDASGNAYLNFGIVRIPRVVGFRFRYSGQGSGIANGVSDPEDFTWLAP